MSICQNAYDSIRSVSVEATIDHTENTINVRWKGDPKASLFELYRKNSSSSSWGEPIMTNAGENTSFTDTNIQHGKLYEYRIVKHTGDSLGYGYLFSGIEFEQKQKNGNVLLIVEDEALPIIQANLLTYENTLKSEGYLPKVRLASSEKSVEEIKTLILDEYQTVDSLTTVILLGNIAVPHSGNINPDGHSDHKGAWPADLYYGDVDGTWTDESVDNSNSNYPRIHNVPGDGNFDQDRSPSQIELIVGRIDMSELRVFEKTEYELLNEYLMKNIEYRTGVHKVRRRAIFRNRNPWREGLGQNALRNFTPIVSEDSIDSGDIFPAFHNSYLWAYGASSGSMTSSNGLGNINTYSNNSFQAIFTSYFGSYYGDYDFENNYLRTILASGRVLSTAWVGAPNWYFHPMGLGFSIGYSTLLSQNNSDEYYAGFFPQSVTINLLGDPTLRAYIVDPPSELSLEETGNNINLAWNESNDSDILGYKVYRRTSSNSYFEVITNELILERNFVDSCVVGQQSYEYLVRAVKHEVTPSGSFINYSTGPIRTIEKGTTQFPESSFTLDYNDGFLETNNLSINASSFQWILSDGRVITSKDFRIPFDATKPISVTLVASNGCFENSSTETLTITSAEVLLDQSISIYPNPTNGNLNISLGSDIKFLEVYNPSGKKVYRALNMKKGSHSIDLRHLPSSVYLLKIQLRGNLLLEKILLLL